MAKGENNRAAQSHFLGDQLETIGDDPVGKAFKHAKRVTEVVRDQSVQQIQCQSDPSEADAEKLSVDWSSHDAGSNKPRANFGIEVTENGIARELVRRFRQSIKYDHNRRKWFIWEDGVWKPDETARIRDRLRNVMCGATEGWNSDDLRKIRRSSFVFGAERLAAADQLVSVTANFWDRDTMLLGCPGATIDLRSGEPKAPDPDDGITKLCGTTPQDGGCPIWLQFLSEVCGGDEDVVAFLQIWAGYLLTGKTDEQSLLFIHGPGGNGKSVFLNIVSRLLGDYCVTAPMETFAKSRSDQHPTGLAMLQGARSVSVSETEEGRSWAEARVKQLTGGDSITARYMQKDFFTYRPQFKLTIVGNNQPMLANVDDAIKRRFLVLPFEHKPKSNDPDLEEKIWKEAPQILSWAIRGCKEWQERGLPRPSAIMQATMSYFEEQDTFSHWRDECCELENPGCFAAAADLYSSWRKFAEDAGEYPGASKSLGQKLKRLGLSSGQKRLGGTNRKVWYGIALKAAHSL